MTHEKRIYPNNLMGGMDFTMPPPGSSRPLTPSVSSERILIRVATSLQLPSSGVSHPPQVPGVMARSPRHTARGRARDTGEAETAEMIGTETVRGSTRGTGRGGGGEAGAGVGTGTGGTGIETGTGTEILRGIGR